MKGRKTSVVGSHIYFNLTNINTLVYTYLFDKSKPLKLLNHFFFGKETLTLEIIELNLIVSKISFPIFINKEFSDSKKSERKIKS